MQSCIGCLINFFFLLWNWQVGESVTNETLAQRRIRCSLQAKVLVAQLRRILCHPMDCSPPWNSPGENTGVGSHSLLQGILPTLELNLGLLYCLQILYHLSHHYSFFFFNLFFSFVVNFVINWNETAMGLHVFPIPIPPPTSLSTRSL